MFSKSTAACAVLALLVALAPAPLSAEPELARKEPAEASFGPVAKAIGDFDFYVLSLSWSPGFCENDGAQRRAQCAPGAGKGFVVHGLWPQYERGFPSDCDGPVSPSRIALAHAEGVFPDEGLARHEWRKHGRCSGRSPSDYFADVRRARESVTIPTPFAHPTRCADLLAAGHSARLRRRQSAAAARNARRHLPQGRARRGAAVLLARSARVPRLSRGRAPGLPRRRDFGPAAALSR